MSSEVIHRVIAKLQVPSENQRVLGLWDVAKLGRVAPEIHDAIIDRLQQDPLGSVRIIARLVLQSLALDDPALVLPDAGASESRDEFLGKLERNEIPVAKRLEALADRPAEIPEICQRLSLLGQAYWRRHADEQMSATQSLAALHQNRDAQIYEAASSALTSMADNCPRGFYRLGELQPFFDAMETNLKPGEYAIAMRDLKSSVLSSWSFQQLEPTHLRPDMVGILLVGPYHQNRPAYQAMLEAIQQIDPKFRPPTMTARTSGGCRFRLMRRLGNGSLACQTDLFRPPADYCSKSKRLGLVGICFLDAPR